MDEELDLAALGFAAFAQTAMRSVLQSTGPWLMQPWLMQPWGVERRADLDKKDFFNGLSPLAHAIENGSALTIWKSAVLD